MSKHKFSNILLTGAAGALGEQIRKTLSQKYKDLAGFE